MNVEICKRLQRGDWYSYSTEYPIRWKILRVYGDNSFDKMFFDKRTGEQRPARCRRLDMTLPQLVKLFEEDKMVFVPPPL